MPQTPAGFVEIPLDTLPGRHYVVYRPEAGDDPLPTILFLHGRGESGDDAWRPIIQGIGSSILWNRARWPYQVIYAQKPRQEELWPSQGEYLNAVLADFETRYPEDPTRRYLTGLSQGGNGTLMLAGRLHWQFAAAAAICGWMDDLEESAMLLRDTPMRLFHGEQDNVILPERSREAAEAIERLGGCVELILYPEDNHNSWDRAYRESDLPTWFLEHQRL